MATPLDDRPFIYAISPDEGIKNPTHIPLFVVRLIYSIMDKDKAQNLNERYIKAFQIAITNFVKSNDIRIMDGIIVKTGFGDKKEVLARAKSDSISINIKFNQWMAKLAQDRDDATKVG